MQKCDYEGKQTVRIYGVRILVDEESGAHHLCFQHTGDFRLSDYEELDLQVLSARLVRRQ